MENTTAQAYALHAKEERRKAARERLSNGDATLMAAERIEARKLREEGMYTPDGRRRFDALGRNNENKRGRKTA